MHPIKSALAIGFAALLLSTSLAGAVSTLPPTGPVTRPETPIVDNGDFGHRFDPTDYFTQEVIDHQPIKTLEPPSLSCEFIYTGGVVTVVIKNSGGPVPAGLWLQLGIADVYSPFLEDYLFDAFLKGGVLTIPLTSFKDPNLFEGHDCEINTSTV
jgi:hypothetical protein